MKRKLHLPSRTQKNRVSGLTSIIDTSFSVGHLRLFLNDFHAFVDVAKLGMGTAYCTPNLMEKIQLYQDHNIKVCFGGTLFEKFYHQQQLEAYKAFMDKYNISLVEISTGTLAIPLAKRVELVQEFKQNFDVISEVGNKDQQQNMSPQTWLTEIKQLLAAGSSYVITEGRSSGTVGIYHADGTMKMDLIEKIGQKIAVENLIFEAPTTKSQMILINRFGANVNLGNIRPNDVLLLETQRCGLRSETFFMET